MKFVKLKFVLFVAAMALATSTFGQGFLQDPKWGADEESRKANALAFNFFKDAYNSKDYPQAIKYLQELLVKAPKAHQNIYIYGVNVYRNRIAGATNLVDKNRAIDSLMLIYDLRAENFGDDPERGHAYILGLKARDYLSYKATDREGVKSMLKKAIEAAGSSVELDLLNIYFKELVDDYKADNIEVTELMADYDKFIPIFEADQSAEGLESKKTFDALFISSGAANCENIESMFKDKIAAAPTDQTLLEKTIALLTRGNCKGDFYLSVAEKLYAVNPSAQTAMVIAAGFEEKKDFVKALKYLNEAIANSTDPIEKANLCIRIAGSELGSGNASTAAKFARQAIEVNPANPYGYMILSQAYANGASSCADTFSRQSVYWLAYDAISEAVSRMDGADTSTLNAQMSAYRANFPTQEEGFFRGLTDGASYNVSCGWITGRTTVRLRK